MMRWTHVLIHHSAGPDTTGLETAGYRKYHKQGNGWDDIGYHWVVEAAGEDYEVLAGRPINWQGSHEVKMNRKALGVCLAGNFSEEPPPDRQLVVAARHVAGLCDALGIPTVNIQAHRDYKATECPGNLFDMDRFRAMVDAARVEREVVEPACAA